MYALSGERLARDCIDRMIDIARPVGSFESLPPDTVQVDDRPGSFRLITKYYSALLKVNTINVTETEELFPSIQGPSEASQVAIVVLSVDDNPKLRPLLSRLNGQSAELAMVIMEADGGQPEDRDFWEGVCSSFGFEYHDYKNLEEAAMSLQCVPWPTLLNRRTAAPALTASKDTQLADLSITPRNLSESRGRSAELQSTMASPSADHSSDSPFGLRDTPTVDPSTHAAQIPANERAVSQQFDDDFAPFVSAGTGSRSTSFDLGDADLLPTEAQLDEIERIIFGGRRSSEPPIPATSSSEILEDSFDLEDIFVRLESLKASTQQMNDAERKQFAASVALVMERNLERG
ncbi:hypothetical protein CROQUDRAFT_654943 [Cronartium quercuum f. sp. fusiforme G11]|uniref:Uncharacterized protein n=1 Tax=Cronartium quercuum f. sp. fusiforme G11 TaxID=708437 RepID=A0A9P6NK10_9BASI|nr:hypothetical protein CROQUDRAFT_654943 [Cronartium quercuum f. sp. fusiforme G11]